MTQGQRQSDIDGSRDRDRGQGQGDIGWEQGLRRSDTRTDGRVT